MSKQAVVVLGTAPDEKTGRRIAGVLVESKLAACVNVVSGVRSVFWWEGKLQDADEVLLICKTDEKRLSDLSEALQEQHPYDCPEVLALPVTGGSKKYLGWITDVLED